jgi:hypothetical protein
MQDVRCAKTGEGIRVVFEGEGSATHLVMAGAPDTQVAVGTGPGESILDRIPMGAATRRGKRVRFAAAIEPVPAGKAPAVAAIVIEDRDGGVRVTVARGETADLVTRIPGRGVEVESGGRTVLSAAEL